MSDVLHDDVEAAVSVEVSKPKKVNLAGNLLFGIPLGFALKTAWDMNQTVKTTEYYARIKGATPFKYEGRMIVSAIRISKKEYDEINKGTRKTVYYFPKDRTYIDA
jgi:hypothetical protein